MIRIPEYEGILRYKMSGRKLVVLSFWYRNCYIKTFKRTNKQWILETNREIEGMNRANRIFGRL